MPTRKVFKDSDAEEDDEVDPLPGDDLNDIEKHLSDDVESDDDDNDAEVEGEDAEPEAVSFTASKINVLDRVHSALREIERDRNKKREKRRNRDLLFKEQKKQKLVRLEQCRLPDDVLAAAAAKSSADSTRPSGQKISISHVAVNKLLPFTDTAVSAPASGDAEGDLIPLENDGFIKAITAKQQAQIASRTQSAVQFRHKQLYGNKHVRRESGSVLLARREKKAAMRR